MAEKSFAFLSISKLHLHFCFLPATCVYFIPASFFIQQPLATFQVLAIFQWACGIHRERGEHRENGGGEQDKLTEPRETHATTGPALGLGREQRWGPTLEEGGSERTVCTETVRVVPKDA